MFVHSVSHTAYRKDVKAYFQGKEGYTIRFNKKEDLFTKESANQIIALAQPMGGLYMGAIPREETLMKELLILSKTNWNNVQIDGTMPITIVAA